MVTRDSLKRVMRLENPRPMAWPAAGKTAACEPAHAGSASDTHLKKRWKINETMTIPDTVGANVDSNPACFWCLVIQVSTYFGESSSFCWWTSPCLLKKCCCADNTIDALTSSTKLQGGIQGLVNVLFWRFQPHQSTWFLDVLHDSPNQWVRMMWKQWICITTREF